MKRLKALLIKEFIQMRRDRLTLSIMLIMPIIQLLIFGFAINTEVKHLATIVYDQSISRDSRELLTSLTSTEYFDIKYVAKSIEEINNAVDSGKAKVGIVIPPDFAEKIKHGRTASVQMIVDASDSMVASSAIAAAQLVTQTKSQEIMLTAYRGFTGKELPPPYDIRIRSWYNPDAITAYYMVPGIMGTIVTLTMVLITSMAIVRERERGTMEQLIVTPMKAWELMFGKIIPYILVGYIQVTVALLVGILVFDLPVRGSILLLYALTSLFLLASLGLGILISTLASTQMQAMQMSFFVIMPSFLLTGFMFPRESMPWLFEVLGNFFPLTFYLQILRGIILKGIGLNMLWMPTLSLIMFIIVVLLVSIKKFKKKLS